MGDTDEAANRARKRDSWKYQLQIENDRVDVIRSEICVLEEELAWAKERAQAAKSKLDAIPLTPLTDTLTKETPK